MKKIYLSLLHRILLFVERHYNALLENKSNLPYASLSPIDNADKDSTYTSALEWALSESKKSNIKNIALTGPYGSGKSSILRTFEKKHAKSKFKFLNISLATFRESTNIQNDIADNELLKQIEVSILQQIFYHEQDSEIPDSRFKKIKKTTFTFTFSTTVFLALYIFSLVYIKYPDFFNSIIAGLLMVSEEVNMWLRLASLLFAVIGTIYLIGKSTKFISKFRLNKINIFDAQIEIGESANRSILNHHLDELIYFFEVTKYNVVVIEDLDRFNQTEIFTKLREINFLLNNSKKINRDIVFIYAIKDDMFKDKDRAKFFDFIIPIIPVINSSNSSQKLLEKREDNNYNWNDDIIEDLSLFINDMRLLHNITNEFNLYHIKQNSSLDRNKLLAILVYKNIYPEDFSLLSNDEGILYQAIHSKNYYINQKVSEIDTELSGVRQEIKRLESISILKVQDLRSIYLLRYISEHPGFSKFHVNNTDFSIIDMVADENFDYLVNNSAKYRRFREGNYQLFLSDFQKKFTDIERLVDPERSYNKKLQDINDMELNKIEELKKNIQNLEKQKDKVKSFKIQELLAKNEIDIKSPTDEQKDIDKNQKALLNVLLRNGYIDENYTDYISIFYEGSLTKSDYDFLLNVKSQSVSPFDFKINRADQLIKKINLIDFDKEFVLNYLLLDFILENEGYEDHRRSILAKLSDESDISIKFIDGFLSVTSNLSKFISSLCSHWTNIWNYIEIKSQYPVDKIDEYLKLILLYADNSSIRFIAKKSNLIKYISAKSGFLHILSDEEKFERIIQLLDIKFSNLNDDGFSNSLFEYIYNNSYYELNHAMIKLIIKKFGSFNQVDFDNRNYYAIRKSACDKLLIYVEENLETYLNDVYLAISTNIHENGESYIDLLNNDNVETETKNLLIRKIETKITSLEDIEDLNIYEFILDAEKLMPTWDSVFHFFKSFENYLLPAVINYLNKEHISQYLSTKNIPLGDADTKSDYKIFCNALITNEALSDESYGLLISSIPYIYHKLDLTSLSLSKVRHLVNKKKLSLNESNYSAIKALSDNVHIQLIEIHKDQFLSDISSYELGEDDLNLLIGSVYLSVSDKIILLNNIDDTLVVSNSDTLKIVGELILSNPMLQIRDSIVKCILNLKSFSTQKRINIFLSQYKKLNEEEVSSFLISLGEPFSNITLRGKKPLLLDNDENMRLAILLKDIGFISSYIQKPNGIKIYTFLT